ncbi:MAG TPA: thioesterase family protein [Gammaproteobacteria bacterium]|nr:thioesterase family protein [Gammaproteobacteria bacterium]
MSKPIELNDVDPGPPLVYKRRIGWNDSDTARIANTARFIDFAMTAVESWYRHVWGRDWHAMHLDLDMGSPCVHAEIDFQSPLEPGDLLGITVRVERMRESSLTFALDGRRHDGTPCFRARYVTTLVAMQPRMHAVPIPPSQRARIETYMAGCSTGETAGTARAPDRTG